VKPEPATNVEDKNRRDFPDILPNMCPRSMRGSAIRFLITFSIFGFLTTGDPVGARSLGELLKALGNSIAHPQTHPRRKAVDTQSPAKGASPTPSPTGTPLNTNNVRVATAVPPSKVGKGDLPYAIPVPGKPGLVTSPFAPGEGYVDVSKFPPGTEVQDPFSGKIFRTP
jgi:hypothetical protein